ncbi:uncharacterized protein LOC109533709 isoform X2 [Dendroctonus ponderosae]|uniref:Uncharacterized protein n=1 Tax=Dendroctonus ponderosae TaxID=77166 RepID=A0AAR5P294_DENPD|nr:uncharacterized protein LOC109533709 isoform X2 [Dendroctonus ponderosae]
MLLYVSFFTAVVFTLLYKIMKIGNEQKLVPAKIKKCPETGEVLVKLIERDVHVRCQEAKNDVLIESRTDFMGTAPKKYVSTCYFKPRTVPAWYTECILIHIGSTKRIYDEKIWFKQKLQPYYWTEKMTTTVNFPPTKAHFSDLTIPVRAEDVHFMSLEAQQIAV